MNKTTRGKIIFIETKKSMTDAKMKKTYYYDYTIAKAVNIKDGIVKTYKLPKDDRIYEVNLTFQVVRVIGDDLLQRAALKLFKKAEKDGAIRFDTIDEAKKAVVAMV